MSRTSIFYRRVDPSERIALGEFLDQLRSQVSCAGLREIPPGAKFTLGDIPVMKCPQCGVTREMYKFDYLGRNSATCIYCRRK